MWPTPGRKTLWRRLFIGGRVTFASGAYEQWQEYEATRKKAWRANATGCFGVNNISWKECRPDFLRTNEKKQTTGGVGTGAVNVECMHEVCIRFQLFNSGQKKKKNLLEISQALPN